MTIAIFIVVLTLVAGLVAAAGDRMGQLAAKRKIRIGKLRPRDASRLVAVLTGMAISIVTFGVVFAVWSDFREALTRYSETKSNLASVLAERDSMLTEIKEAQSGRDDAIKAQQDAEQALRDAEELTTAAQNKLIALEDQLSVADLQIKDKEREIGEKQKQVDKIQKELQAARQEMENVALIKEGDQIQLDALRKLNNQAIADISRLNAEIEELKRKEALIPPAELLAYWQLNPGGASVFDQMGDKLRGLQAELAKEEFQLDEGVLEAMREFSTGFSIGEQGAVVVVRNAVGVYEEGDKVQLDFSGLQLIPILSSGSDLLTIAVTEGGSKVYAMGGSQPALNLGSTIDLNFIQRLEVLYRDTANSSGFLPRISGGIDTSVMNELMFRAEEINARQKPYVIHLRAPRVMNALDGPRGLADLEIVITDGNL